MNMHANQCFNPAIYTLDEENDNSTYLHRLSFDSHFLLEKVLLPPELPSHANTAIGEGGEHFT